MSGTVNDKPRKIYLDLLRIIACLFVIFNHTGQLGDVGFLQFLSYPPGCAGFWISLLISIICKTGVPIFFMISGATLLGKEERIIDTWKRIPRIFADLLLFSLLYCWTDALFSGEVFSLEETIYGIIKSDYTHLWFLYAYIAFLISLPFFRKMIKGLDEVGSVYLLVTAFFVLGVLRCFEYSVISINPNLIISWIAANIFIFPAAGYILSTIIDIRKISYKIIILVWAVAALGIAWVMRIEYDIQTINPGDATEEFITSFSLVISVAIFVLVKKAYGNRTCNSKLGVLIVETGKCVYGIYLIHFWVLCDIPICADIWRTFIAICPFGYLVGSIICSIFVFVICGIIVFVLRKIPGVKSIL